MFSLVFRETNEIRQSVVQKLTLFRFNAFITVCRPIALQ